MKQYPEIQGPRKAPREHCIAFYKYDGSNIRVEWTKKRKWFKFGSRKQLIDRTHPFLADSIDIFLETYGDDLDNIFRTNRNFRNCQNVTVFVEYFGPNSFAGFHEPDDKKEVVLLDISVHKKGMIPPNEFVKMFGHLKIPEIIYEGKFNAQFIKDIEEGKYQVEEGVVAKGQLPRGRPPHNLWMAKCKTRKWMERLKKEAVENIALKNQLADNIREQNE